MIPYSQHTNRKKDESFSQYKVINKKMTLVKEIICGVNYCKPPILYPTIQSENNITTFTNGTVGKITTNPVLDLNDIVNFIPPTVYIYISLLDKLGKTGSLTFDTVKLFSEGYPIGGTQSSLQVGIFKLNNGATKFDSNTYATIGSGRSAVSSTVNLYQNNSLSGGRFYNFTFSNGLKLYAFDQTTGEQNYYFLGITGDAGVAPIASTSYNNDDSNNLIYYSNSPVSIDTMGSPVVPPLKPEGVPYYVLYES